MKRRKISAWLFLLVMLLLAVPAYQFHQTWISILYVIVWLLILGYAIKSIWHDYHNRH
ncbi:hypothetical protein M3M38_06600 [Fructilactobacillus cliffordii]|uniref:hypothetical protein n=1 Tax=Fructilactobacillus cliffordii TaxID=2940299 RepID=UPI0020938B6D|nr:hypothetical protein [Fructilactobacillus cliffordii]USS86351.1 hypothetical protein M3M38_06600 [Fructilactobacillus cliffordii]